MGRQTRRAGSNKSRGKANQPPTGQGKEPSAHHPEPNLGDSEDEAALRPAPEDKPKRRKAGR